MEDKTPQSVHKCVSKDSVMVLNVVHVQFRWEENNKNRNAY